MLMEEKIDVVLWLTSSRVGLNTCRPPSEEPTHMRLSASSAIVTTLPVRWNVFRCRRVFPDVMSQTNSPLSIPTHRRLDESMNISCTNFVGNALSHGWFAALKNVTFPVWGVVEGEAAVACADPESALRVALYACDEIVAECVGERGVVVEHIVASREAEHTFVECSEP